jgi:hypothetical protein
MQVLPTDDVQIPNIHACHHTTPKMPSVSSCSLLFFDAFKDRPPAFVALYADQYMISKEMCPKEARYPMHSMPTLVLNAVRSLAGIVVRADYAVRIPFPKGVLD